jgi:hypothetical protein
MKTSLLRSVAAFALLGSFAFAAPLRARRADGDDAPKKPLPAAKPSVDPGKLKGDYLEARTCDVWVGSCFANSETCEAGKQATIAWKFTEGAWKGTDLKGLAAVLVIDAKSTIGGKFHSPLPVRDVLLLDAKANDAQLVALRDFVKARMGELAGNVVEERCVEIKLETGCCDKKGCAKLKAGDVVKVETKCLDDSDHVCGHEETYYPPLNALSESLAAHTVEHVVKGTLLSHEWADRDSRSSFVGKFELDSPAAEKKVDPDEIRAH